MLCCWPNLQVNYGKRLYKAGTTAGCWAGSSKDAVFSLNSGGRWETVTWRPSQGCRDLTWDDLWGPDSPYCGSDGVVRGCLQISMAD